jgi:predicted nucleic acid-binding protein
MVEILAVDAKAIDLALSSEFKDFEDAIQYFVARSNNVEILLTRNLKDYSEAKIPVMTAESFLTLR